MHIIITLLVLTQAQVTVDKKTQTKLGLKPSLDDTYMIYTFDEYVVLLKELAELDYLRLEIPILKKQVNIFKVQDKLKDEIIQSKNTAISTLQSRGERLTEKYEQCLDSKAKTEGGSIWPWVIAGGSLLVAIVGVSFAGYYGAKYRMD